MRLSIYHLRPVVFILTWAIASIWLTCQAYACIDNFSYAEVNIVSEKPTPAPTLAPEEVVTIQLKALQANDAADTGIEIAFNFAAPENKKYNGPIDFFKALVKNPTYEALLNCKKYETRKIYVKGNEAQQIVVVTDKNGRKAAYLFSLSKQTQGTYKGCWMTESVIRIEYQDKTVNA